MGVRCALAAGGLRSRRYATLNCNPACSGAAAHYILLSRLLSKPMLSLMMPFTFLVIVPAAELLRSPEMESEGGKSWVEVYGNDPLQHPYLYILFLGMDGRGDYVPCRQLRDKYNVQRRDVHRPGEGDEEDNGVPERQQPGV